jgi:hypothetical protein
MNTSTGEETVNVPLTRTKARRMDVVIAIMRIRLRVEVVDE